MSNSVDRKKRIEELSEKVELNELRARDAAARYAIVEAELKLMNLREAMDKRPGLLSACSEAGEYRWMLEEFRVSLFAQQLGTRQAVSEKRLKARWLDVLAWMEKNR